MQTILLYLTLGLGGGALFACLGVSASITHRASGVMNLAIGAMAMIPALAYHSLRVQGDLILPVVWLPSKFHLADHLPTVVAVAIALALGVAVFVVALVLVFHPMRDSPAVTKAVASIGISLVLLAVANQRYGTVTRLTPALLPNGLVHLFGGEIPADRLGFVLVAVGLTALCTLFFRVPRAGLVLRAGSDNERGVLLLGYSPLRSALVAWALAGFVASAGAVVLASFASVAPSQFGLYAVPALGAALAGRFRNLWVVCAVGLIIGALQGLAVHLGALQSLPRTLQGGFDDAMPLVVIVVTLSFSGSPLPRRGALLERRFPAAAPAPPWWALSLVLALALGVGWFGGSSLRLSLVQTVIAAVLALSMVVSAGYISQVSLAQVTIAGLAAYLLAGLTTGLHVPFPFAPALAVLGAAALGFLVGIPALRIRGAQLMVVSLAFAVAINRLVLQNGELGRSAFGLTVAPARIFGFDLGTFGPGGFPAPRSVVMIVLIAGASFLAIANLRRGRTGLRWLAVRGNEGAAAACGIDVVRTKLLASAVAVGLAGVAGVLIAQNSQSLSYRLFDTDIALALVALAYLGGVASIWGAVVAGLLAAGGIAEQLFGFGSGKEGNSLLYGVALIVVCMVAPGGLAGIGSSVIARVRTWRGRADVAPPPSTLPPEPVAAGSGTGRG